MAAPSDEHELTESLQQDNNFDSLTEPVTPTSPSSSRKKRINLENQQKHKRKRLLHSGEGKNPEANCRCTNFCKAASLNSEDIQFNFRKLYDNQTKVDQDKFILSLLQTSTVKRKRVGDAARKKARDVTTKISSTQECRPK